MTDLRTEISEADQALFGEQGTPAPAPEVDAQQLMADAGVEIPSEPDPMPEQVASLFEQAGIAIPGVENNAPSTEQAVQAEQAQQVIPEVESEPEYTQQDMMNAYMQQQQQLSQQLAELQQQQMMQQQQQAQPPAQPQLNLNDPQQLANAMETVGLDPTSATDVYMFRSDFERRTQQQQYETRINELQHYISNMHQQNVYAQHEAAVDAQVDATLNVFGEIPAQVASNIKHHAATMLSEGLAQDYGQAIQHAVAPYLPLLQMVQQAPAAPTAQPAQQIAPPTKREVGGQAVLAAALSGGSSGHGPTLNDLDVDALEKALFRNN